MRIFILYIIFSSWIIYNSNAQEVEHNYLVGTEATNCDSLDLSGLSSDESIVAIRHYTYRFDQVFKLTRTKGLQLGEYFSCDAEVGFLIIKFDGKEKLYLKIEKRIWEELISSSDPEGYYLGIKQQLIEHP